MLFALMTSDPTDVNGWVMSLAKLSDVEYDVIDISSHDWLEKCQKKSYSLFLLRAPGHTNSIKQMFDERIIILASVLKKPIYPPLSEILIYENKKFLSYWLKAMEIPFPRTDVFYDKQDANGYINHIKFPVIAKVNIGSSGKGVSIIRSSYEAKRYVRKAFSKGIRPYIGPNIRTASLFRKLKNAFNKKGLIKKRMKSYKAIYREPQKYVIFQEFVAHDYEWRAVVIGDSYFAHKKIVDGFKASGSLQKDYENPSLKLLDFVRDLCRKGTIVSASIDLFETKDGFLVNEIQTFFGQSDSFQMKVDGVIGRYRYVSDKWVFEPGDFASNQCYDLRLSHAIRQLNTK